MRLRGLLMAAFLLLTAGCDAGAFLGDGDGGGTEPTPDARRCAEIFGEPRPGRPPAGVTVLLADGSASGFSRQDASRRQDWGKMLGRLFPEKGDVQVMVGVFGGDVDWRFEKMTPGESTDQARTANDHRDALACFRSDLAVALREPPGKPQTDVLRALAEAADQVRARKGRKTIYIATDGLSNTGCADLRAAPLGDLTAIPGIVTQCETELPRLGEEFRVRLLGLGNPADGWSDVKTPHRTWLVALWRQLCAATGATCEEPLAESPEQAASSSGPPPADADVPVPKLKITEGNPTVLSVPASVLFDVDSADLATGRAQDALEEVLRYLGGVRHSKVVVAGHTDSTGTPEHNRDLSRRRAEAVRRALAARGVTGLSATGYGAEKPACVPEIRNGVADRVNMACNRRVEIIVYT